MADPVIEQPPTTETTVEKHETTTTKGDIPVKVKAGFDDGVKLLISAALILTYCVSYLYGQYTGRNASEGVAAGLTNFVMLVVGFWMGTSASSSLKDKMKGNA